MSLIEQIEQAASTINKLNIPVIEQEIKQLEKQFDLKSKDPKEVVINMGWCIVRYIIVDSIENQ